MKLYVKFNGNWCWTSPTWSQVQFWSSWSSTRRSRVELQLDQNWTWVELHEVIHHRLQSSPSRPSWSPTRQRRVGLQLGRDGLDWSCTRWTSVDSTQGHRVQVQVQRGAAELNLDLDEVALSWSCTRRRTSTSRPSWSSTRRSRVELQLGRDVLVLLRVQLQCNVDELGGKYTEAEPRCTCPPYESTLQSSQRWSTECNFSAMLTSWEASTPRRSRGVLVLPTSQHCRGVCGGSPSATPMQIWREGRQVHRGEAEVYLPFLRVKFAPSRWSTTPITVGLNVSTLSAPPLPWVHWPIPLLQQVKSSMITEQSGILIHLGTFVLHPIYFACKDNTFLRKICVFNNSTVLEVTKQEQL